METNSTSARVVRVRDFCRALSLPSSTVYRMIQAGRLKAIRLEVSPANPQGVIRIPASEIDRLLSGGGDVSP